MAANIFKTLLSFLLLTVVVSTSAQEKSETVESGKSNLTVLVKYKSQPEKQDDALSGLNALILEVKKNHTLLI